MLIFQREDRQTGNPIVGQVDQKNGQNTSIYALTEQMTKNDLHQSSKRKRLIKKRPVQQLIISQVRSPG